MKVGGQADRLHPSALGYGKAGHPPQIPPDSDLIFDLELIAVKWPGFRPARGTGLFAAGGPLVRAPARSS